MRLALKIDVDTERGTRIGVPRLVEALQHHRAGATFLFSLGPDNTGRAIRRVFRPGFMRKVSRTSVVEHYGIRTLLNGTLLPGPDIGRKHAALMRSVRDAGFETGIHTWDHVRWQDYVANRDAAWTEQELRRACDRYIEIFGTPARVHGAAGWQMNAHAYRLTQTLGFSYCSDGRGTAPYLPVVEGTAIRCAQLPTTLPTLDELIGVEGATPQDAARRLLELTATRSPTGHVYTLHAELEGMKLADVFETLLGGWKNQGYELTSLAGYARDLDFAGLPHCAADWGEIPGRSGALALQGPAVAGVQ